MALPINLIASMQRSGLNDAEIIRRLREQGYSEKEINDAFNQARIKSAIKTEDFSEPTIEEAPTMRVGATKRRNYQNQPSQNQRGQDFSVPTPSPSQSGEEYETAEYQQAMPSEAQSPYGDYGEYGQAQEQAYGYDSAYTSETFEEIAESIIEEKWRDFTDKVGDVQGWKESTERELERIEKRIDKIDDAITAIHSAFLEKVGEYGKGMKGLGSDVKAVEKALSQILEPLMKNVKELKSVTESIKAREGIRKKKP